MVNLTYGVLIPNGDGTYTYDLKGTDIVSTLNGETSVYSPGDIAWVLTCAALIIFMIPGLGYLYSGLARRKNALQLLFLTMLSLAIVSFQWFFIGYSLVFSKTGGSFFGDGLNVGFRGVLEAPVPESNGKIPEIVFATYQMMFANLVPAVLLGAAAERSRTLPAMLFIFCWTTLVYDMLAHWIWSVNGWANAWGVLDYAGGVPVEIASGAGGLAYSYFIGKRRGFGTERLMFKPSNVSSITLGTVMLWVGWMGFNGGSCFAASLKAAMSIFNTNLAASVGAIVWMIMDFRLERKWSMVGFCTGAIAGLVAITPAAGYVGAPASALIGLVSAAVSNLATRLKSTMRVDDPMDIFAVHALAGVVGTIMTGIFAQSSVSANDGFSEIPGGWLNGHWVQIGKQIAWVAVGFAWTFVVTLAIMFVINLIPGCKFRASDEAEIVGMDEVEHDEYIADYAFFRRDLEGNEEFEIEYNNWRHNSLVPPQGTTDAPNMWAGYTPQATPGAAVRMADAVQHVRDRERSQSRSQSRGRRPAKPLYPLSTTHEVQHDIVDPEKHVHYNAEEGDATAVNSDHHSDKEKEAHSVVSEKPVATPPDGHSPTTNPHPHDTQSTLSPDARP